MLHSVYWCTCTTSTFTQFSEQCKLYNDAVTFLTCYYTLNLKLLYLLLKLQSSLKCYFMVQHYITE